MCRPGFLLFCIVALFCFVTSPCRAECGDTEQDRIVWARERMHPGISREQLTLVNQWLKNSTGSCPESGDLWYYRGLVATQLAAANDARYFFQKAQEHASPAQQQHFNPFLLVTPARVTSGTGKPEKYALIVGVTRFPNSDDFLEFSAKDAQALRKYLVETAHFSEDHVKVLVDQEATTQNIREAFGEIRSKAKPDDLVLIYFSSHGRPRDLDPTGLSYVLTYDTDTSTQAKTFATGLLMVELAELGRWVKAHDYVLLLDTCYSGAAQAGVGTNATAAGSNGLDPLQGLDGSGRRVVITASRADEKSYEDQASQHGYFTRFLLDSLNQNQGRPLSSIFTYLQSHLEPEVEKASGHQQHPVMQVFGDGQDIVLNPATTTASASTTSPPASLLSNRLN